MCNIIVAILYMTHTCFRVEINHFLFVRIFPYVLKGNRNTLSDSIKDYETLLIMCSKAI